MVEASPIDDYGNVTSSSDDGRVTFLPASLNEVIKIQVLEDSTPEDDEEFFVEVIYHFVIHHLSLCLFFWCNQLGKFIGIYCVVVRLQITKSVGYGEHYEDSAKEETLDIDRHLAPSLQPCPDFIQFSTGVGNFPVGGLI